MAAPQLRQVDLWRPDIAWDRREDGSILVWQREPLREPARRLSDRIAHWAQAAPDRVWMAERARDGAWRGVTYGELLPLIRSIGAALIGLGLSTERPLVILSGNSVAHALMALGAQHAGIPSAALATAYSTAPGGHAKLEAIREQITPGAVFAEDADAFAPAMEAAFADLPRLGRTGAGLALDWDAMLATEPDPALEDAHDSTGPDTVAKFMFTSGTTGAPKAVVQTQRMLCSNIEMVLDCYAWLRDEPPVVVDWAPWNHVASGNKVFNLVLYAGGTFYLDAGKPTPALIGETIRNLREVSPTWYFNVPAGYEMLIEAMRADRALAESFFRRLKMMMYAGAGMSEPVWNGLHDLAAEVAGEHVLLCTGLGATETAPFALMCTEPQDRPGNVGLPSRGLILKLVPVEEGRWDARLKGPSITPGYWRDPSLTAEAFDEEGFYRLGDALSFADPDDPARGFFFEGRTAENFKMATGTWVAVGPLRTALTDALGGLARDAVIAGAERMELGAFLLPFRPAMERLVPEGAGMTDADLYAHPVLRTEIARRLAAYNARNPSASRRVPRAMILADPLDLGAGEVTDKGSVNQRAVLRQRAGLVDVLFSEDDPRVISSEGS